MLRTLEEVFAENLRKFRGTRTQAELAELVGTPLVTYQRWEAGSIPQGPNRAALIKALGVPETHLFVDWESFTPKESAGRASLLAEILSFLGTANERQLRLTLDAVEDIRGASGGVQDSLLSRKQKPSSTG